MRFLIIVLCFYSFHFASSQDIKIQYIANEGVLIESGEDKVLVDAIFKSTYSMYENTPDSIFNKIKNQESPYDGIDLMLFSHVHSDHFTASMVNEIISSNKEIKILVNQQVKDSLIVNGLDEINQKRILVFDNGDYQRNDLGSIKVATFKVDHASSSTFGWIENSAHIIELNGKSILHVGDPEYANEETFKHEVSIENIDVAILPYWLIYDDKTLLYNASFIKARHYIANHIPRKEMRKVKEFCKAYPEVSVIDHGEDFVLE